MMWDYFLEKENHHTELANIHFKNRKDCKHSGEGAYSRLVRDSHSAASYYW